MKTIIFLIILISTPLFSYGQEGRLNLDLKLPHVNQLSLNLNKNLKDSELGFNGYGIGLEYFYKEQKFIETSSSFVMTFEFPFPAPVDSEYNKLLSSFYISLTDNFMKGKFTYGYGINYSMNIRNEFTRNLGYNEEELFEEYSNYDINKDLGLIFNTYYKIGNTLNVGLIYRPSLLKIDNGVKPIYEHLLSIELNWRLKLGNLKK